MIRRPPRSTHCISSAASDVYKRQVTVGGRGGKMVVIRGDEMKGLKVHVEHVLMHTTDVCLTTKGSFRKSKYVEVNDGIKQEETKGMAEERLLVLQIYPSVDIIKKYISSNDKLYVISLLLI
eukprot:TRINITY_DN12109_c0_g1_i5.p2 TRINITY_DN12109_c0_g1~~TRINITY_DN12109_c0_g1_i5.p2  ORF type:complete len:129 (+),score=37.99 TRINITY_DN12109_c0_g1_i5:23-388(+)